MTNIIDKFNSTLKAKKLTISFAESITAGLLASSVASIPGASSILRGSIVTYNEELKVALLGVGVETLNKYKAESKQTTLEMVNGLSKMNLKSDIYLSITGTASESINSYNVGAPVGSVFIAIIYNDNLYEFNTILSGNRNHIREQAVIFSLEKVLSVIK